MKESSLCGITAFVSSKSINPLSLFLLTNTLTQHFHFKYVGRIPTSLIKIFISEGVVKHGQGCLPTPLHVVQPHPSFTTRGDMLCLLIGTMILPSITGFTTNWKCFTTSYSEVYIYGTARANVVVTLYHVHLTEIHRIFCLEGNQKMFCMSLHRYFA